MPAPTVKPADAAKIDDEAGRLAAQAGDDFSIVEVESHGVSPLDGLRDKLREASEKLYVDLEVPRWQELIGIRVFVRYLPLSPAYANATSLKFEKIGGDDWQIQANAQLLVKYCVGVYVQDRTGDKLSMRPGDPDGPWTKFDDQLADALGPSRVKERSAIGTCRGLYWTDGDVTAAALALADWSTKISEQAEKDFQTP
jgi:hypothetical protein